MYINLFVCVSVWIPWGGIFSPWLSQQSSWVVISTPFTFWRMSPIRMPAWHRLSNRKKFRAITNKWQKDLPKPAKLIKHHTTMMNPVTRFPLVESKTNFGNFNDESLSAQRSVDSTFRCLFGRGTFENLHDAQLIQINSHGIFRPLGIHVMAKRPPGNSCHAMWKIWGGNQALTCLDKRLRTKRSSCIWCWVKLNYIQKGRICHHSYSCHKSRFHNGWVK